MKSTSEQPPHFAITKFEMGDALQLRERHAALTTEWQEVNTFGEALKLEVAEATRKTNFKDKAALDSLSFKRLQLEMVPNKLIQIEEDLAALEEEIKNFVSGPFTKAIGDLERHELKLARAALFKKFRPHCNADYEAEAQADNSTTIQAIISKFYWYSFALTPMQNLESGLVILEKWTPPEPVV